MKEEQKHNNISIPGKTSGFAAINGVSTIDTFCASLPALQDFWCVSVKLYGQQIVKDFLE